MSLFKRLFNAVRSGSVSNEQWDEIRSNLISADLGVKLVDQVIAEAKLAKPEDAQQSITNVIQQWLSSKDRATAKNSDRATTILVVGVNGTGKTTATAKLANLIKIEGNSVLLAAADTCRAAAVDELQTWAKRIDVGVVSGAANGDPAAVAFSAITKAKSENYDYLLVDTAGRLHTKENLMQELGKVIRVIEKHSPVEKGTHARVNGRLTFLARSFDHSERLPSGLHGLCTANAGRSTTPRCGNEGHRARAEFARKEVWTSRCGYQYMVNHFPFLSFHFVLYHHENK